MQILNNAPAFSVWTNYTANVANLRQSMQKLSSGLQINTAADDPAGLALSQRLLQQADNSSAVEQNIQNALSYSDMADMWIQNIQEMLRHLTPTIWAG